eukprot:TRINITY_DN45357_c0_g1_i1.p1 TRINITY_DN45357_c0_g1~~TRINITY_DN45357_c0_g1_i1.p1  ORF type:complete len:581 (-),score=77.23 TRINITY_DN45357_c0_g1_i1:110-1852(-)
MGNGASIHEISLRGECTLPSVARVQAAHQCDRFRLALDRHDQFLAKERRLCPVNGFDATTAYQQPLIRGKLDRHLTTLDDVAQSYCADEHRCRGHSEIPVEAIHGGVRGIMPLGDDATIACSCHDGGMFVYNWREGSVVALLRLGGVSADVSRSDGAVVRMCQAHEGHASLATGDEHGFVSLWDLSSASKSLEVRAHEGPVTGICYQPERNVVISTATDTYLMVYDLQHQEITHRAMPASFTDGCGIPNTCLAIAQRRGVLLVGGADGKVRLWSKDDGGMRRLGGLPCVGCKPTQCVVSPDENLVVVSATRGDKIICSGLDRPGGVFFYDLRKLGGLTDAQGVEGFSSSAVVAEHISSPGPVEGAVDMTIAPATTGTVAKELLALTLLDGRLQSFHLDGSGPPVVVGDEHPELCNPVPVAQFSFDIFGGSENTLGIKPCAIAAAGRYVFVGTTAPSMHIYRRTLDDLYGHDSYVRREPLQPLTLTSRVVPNKPTHRGTRDVQGSVLEHVTAAVHRDCVRLAPIVAMHEENQYHPHMSPRHILGDVGAPFYPYKMPVPVSGVAHGIIPRPALQSPRRLPPL